MCQSTSKSYPYLNGGEWSILRLIVVSVLFEDGQYSLVRVEDLFACLRSGQYNFAAREYQQNH